MKQLKIKGAGEEEKDIMPFLRSMVHHHRGTTTTFINSEDMLGEALLGFAQSYSRYDAKSKASLLTFAFLRVNGQLSKARDRENGFFNNHVGCDVQTIQTVIEPVAEEEVIRKSMINLIMQRIETLPHHVGAVLIWTYLEELGDAIILQRLREHDAGYHIEDVQSLRTQGLEELRRYFRITS